MEKYGVETDPALEKAAGVGATCPVCGAKTEQHGPVTKCPACGTKPFEKTDGSKEKEEG